MYIQEAHASDMWQMASNLKQDVIFTDPRDLSERVAVAGTCVTRLGLRIPALLDDMQNHTEAAYTAWPDRLYLIDRDGRIRYKSAPGPFGFEPAALEAGLKALLAAP